MMQATSALWLGLVDLEQLLVDAWEEEFAAWPNDTQVRRGSIETVAGVDAVVTAGNSYGQMDGGVDRAVAEHFPGIQTAVWKAIAEESHGYLPVGSALVVPTASTQVPWLVYAPTMRVPMSLRSFDTVVHDAFWAALVAIQRHNVARPDLVIRSVASPGFGTGFGQVEPRRAAQLMAAAYRCWRAGPTAQISDRERDLAPEPDPSGWG